MNRAAAPSVRPEWSRPIDFLPRPLLLPDRPTRAVLLGWLTAFVPSLLLGAIVTGLLPELQQPDLPVTNWQMAVMLVVMAPIVETLIMAAVLAVLLRLMPPSAAVIVSAFGWGIAHSLAAPAWGLVVWWPFLVFSTLYVVWRQRSLFAAIAVPASVHALQNLVPAVSLFLAHRA